MKTTPLSKTRKTPEGKARVKAWAIFSKYIRLRDCESYRKGGMTAPCFTCGKVCRFDDLQSGHFVPGRGNAVLFDEECVHAQCASCNIFHHGNPAAYWEKMLDIYGEDQTREIAARRKQIKKYTLQDYLDIIENYTKLIKTFNYEL